MIKHHATCNADYPEKPEGELPQHIVEIDVSTHGNPRETLLQCSDCGAYELRVESSV